MARPPKDGVRRTIRFDPELDAVLQSECERLGIDISSVLSVLLRGHFGLDGSRGGQVTQDALASAAAAGPHLEAAFRLLTGSHPDDFKDRADAIGALGAGPACEVWLALWQLRALHGLQEWVYLCH